MPRFSLLLVACLASVACTNPTENDPGLSGRRLSVGETSACFLAQAGGLVCWGSNFNQEFGYQSPNNGAFAGSGVPIEIDVVTQKLLSISGGWGQHRCGVSDTRSGVCWGRSGNGQLGDGQVGPAAGGNPPVAVSGTTQWSDIRVGRLITCGLSTTEEAWCWGLNQRGELGDTTLTNGDRVVVPGKVVGGIKFKEVVPGWLHTCGISTSGTAYCWGANYYGELGIGAADTLPHAKPLPVASTQQFKSISLGARSTCAITTADQLMCWGFNGTAQLGVGDTTDRHVPTPVGGSLKFTQVSLGSGFADGVRPNIPRPAFNPAVAASIAHGCALTDTQLAYCWGWNAAGQVGDGSVTERRTPVAVGGGLKFTSIMLGGAYSCALTEAAALYCWGSNYFGQLGDGSFLDKSLPIRVPIP